MSQEPISVQFPLTGEWCAVNTPGHEVPSHGTDMLGQRYAYDFIQIDWTSDKEFKVHNRNPVWGFIFGVRLKNFFCWSQPILSPFDGEVVEAADGVKERNPVHAIRELYSIYKNTRDFKNEVDYNSIKNSDLHHLLGNYLILKGDEAFALIAHARCGSILVAPGEQISAGQQLAEVGHSGNSTGPHLHFQLMDSQKLMEAKGLQCCFKQYDSWQNDRWNSVENGIPARRERIRAQ